jgi:hypothetical protein
MAVVLIAGFRLPFALSLLIHAACYLAFGWLVLAERKSAVLAAGDVVPLIAGLLLLAVAVAPIQSSDVWSYAIYGRMASVHHVSPYRHVPAEFVHDPYLRHVATVWRQSPAVYGPLFTGVSAVAMRIVGESAVAARLFFQLLAGGSVALALLVVHRKTTAVLPLILVGLNPLVVIGVVNAGHNDAIVGLLLLLGVVLLTDDRPMLAGVVMAAAVLIKLTAAFPLAAVAVWLAFRKGWRPTAVFAGAAAVISLVGIALAGGRDILEPLQSAQLHISGGSLWRWPTHFLIGESIKDGLRGRVAGPLVRAEVARWAAATVVALTALVAFSRRRDLTPAIACGAGALVYVLVGQYVQPWYLAWALPSLALAYRSRFALLAVTVGAVQHLVYVPDTQRSRAITAAHPGHLDVAQWIVRVYLVPVLTAMAVAAVVVLAVQRLRVRASSADLG